MASTSDIRNGLVIRFNNDLYSVVEFLHVKPGKGAAFVRTKLKSVTTGKVVENTFPSGAKLETVRVERNKYQYLFQDGESYMFMDQETYEQIPVPGHKVTGEAFLVEGMECEILFNTDDDIILEVEIPKFVELEVTYTEPGFKGDTASNTTKPATLSTGAQVKVPLFINIGDNVRVDTRTGEYIERVKN